VKRRRRLLELLALLSLLSCSHRQRFPDSPAFRACKAVCEEEGGETGGVYEDADHIFCECKKTKPEGT
jgi:hypothetical protein